MKNEDVIIAFLKGKSGHSLNLYTEGQNLINYNTRIAYKDNDLLWLNKTKYSRTTSKIQNKLDNIAQEYYPKTKIINYEGE